LFLFCGFFLVGTLLFYTQWVSRFAVAEAVRGELEQIALSLAGEAEALLMEEIRQAPGLAETPRVRNFVAEKNRSYPQEDPSEVADFLKSKNDTFVKAPKTSPLVSGLIENSVSVWLKGLRESPDGKAAEALITDRYGAVIASTTRPESYYLADQNWWQLAHKRAPNGLYPSLQEDSGGREVAFASPILDDSGQVIGVLRIVVDVRKLFSRLQAVKIGKTGRVYLLTPDGTSLVAGPSGPNDWDKDSPGMSFTAKRADRKGLLFAAARVSLPRSPGPESVRGRGWTIFVEKELREVVSHLRDYYLRAIGVGVLAVLVLGVNFYGATRLMLEPRLGKIALKAVWRYVILGVVLLFVAWLFYGVAPRKLLTVDELIQKQSKIYQPKDRERQTRIEEVEKPKP
jgi:hypothetical protein